MSHNSNSSIFILLKQLWTHLELKKKTRFKFLLVLMIIATFAEIIGIGLVIPFLGALTSPEYVFEHPASQYLIQIFNIRTPSEMLTLITVLFVAFSLIAGAVRLLLLWSTTRLSYSTGADISIKAYRNTLYQPYSVHVSRNSNEVISAISEKTDITTEIMTEFLGMLSSIIMILIIFLVLFFIEPIAAISIFFGFGGAYVLIILLIKRKLLRNGEIIAEKTTSVIKLIQEGLGAIRDVLIDGSQDAYCKIYAKSDASLRTAQGSNWFLSRSPRYVMEAIGLMVIGITAYILAGQPDGVIKAIPLLGALGLGAQRILPVLQQGYYSFVFIRGSQASLRDTLQLLNQDLPDYIDHPHIETLDFNSEIELINISFRYSHSSPYVIKNLNLKIPKGSRIGFIGATGSGKSTLIDIVMGLLQPSEGDLLVDGTILSSKKYREWRGNIAHVPQSIFLSDATIAENIAFGIPKKEIDYSLVKSAANNAKISEFIETMPLHYDSYVGERGVKLSGGQRQRIGIARALYKQASVIVLDEATSALDNNTELEVMKAIDSLSSDLTILIVAHRLTSLQGCSQIVEMDKGKIINLHEYQNIIEGDKSK